MPLQPGEVSLLTVFADVHLYFSSPAAKPLHDRFDRKSYLYLYHDVMNKRGRIEIANHAGTVHQDAVSGYLDSAVVEYSHKQPTLFTFTLESQTHTLSSQRNDGTQWHIPAFDPRGETKYLYKIHSVDIYLWTAKDASLFLDSLRRVLQPHQLDLLDAPAPLSDSRESVSIVVQQLEHAAIHTPNSYTRSDSISTTHTSNSMLTPNSHYTPIVPPVSPLEGQQSTTAFVPVAYNPAAPAAPEPIAHREKTPPPPDAEGGTGLMGPTGYNQGSQYPFPGPPQHVSFSPQQTPYMPGPPTSPPPKHGIQRSYTMGPISSPPAIPGPPQSPYASSFAPPPRATPPQDPNANHYEQQPPTPGLQRQSSTPAAVHHNMYTPGQLQQPVTATQYASYPASYTPGAAQAPTTPGHPTTPSFAPLHSPGLSSQQQQQQQQQHQYAYGVHDSSNINHGIHGQLYRPEEGAKPAQPGVGQAAATGRLEQRAEKLEKGVSRFLKRLDKKF